MTPPNFSNSSKFQILQRQPTRQLALQISPSGFLLRFPVFGSWTQWNLLTVDTCDYIRVVRCSSRYSQVQHSACSPLYPTMRSDRSDRPDTLDHLRTPSLDARVARRSTGCSSWTGKISPHVPGCHFACSAPIITRVILSTYVCCYHIWYQHQPGSATQKWKQFD